ncbi:unnamed protein product [Lasius platythorax]|uniref:HAT C-terminal dimerisation domain-containing protein n=1 Tax=Lasius platythorax TaxID=488582 RepID=A0AAV2MWK0_9HYME
MTDTLMKQLSARFKDVENNILITDATLLDPRFKRLEFSEQNKADAAYRSLKQKDSDEEVARTKATGNSTAAGIVELDKYKQEPLIKRSEDSLIWWYQRQDLYPRLYKIVKKRLYCSNLCSM